MLMMGELGESLASFQNALEFTGREKDNVNMTSTGLGQTRATRTLRTSGEIPKYQDTPKVRTSQRLYCPHFVRVLTN